MTCIVGIEKDGKVYMGGDSASANRTEMTVDQSTEPKVFIRGDYIMGYTTSWRMGQILRHCGRIPKPPCKPESVEELDEFMVKKFIAKVIKIFDKEGFVPEDDHVRSGAGHFLVGTHGRLYTVQPDWQCLHLSRKWAAVGCGEQFALGSLYATSGTNWRAETKIREALKAAAYYSAGVCEPFLVRAL